jgi:hypothetical protein
VLTHEDVEQSHSGVPGRGNVEQERSQVHDGQHRHSKAEQQQKYSTCVGQIKIETDGVE